MRRFTYLTALAGALALAGAAEAQSLRAFSDLAFGDSVEQVERKTRAALDDGRFARDCYGCPVRAKLGDLALEVATEFHEDRLWRVSLRHRSTARGKGDAPALEPIWTDLRDMIASRHGQPRVSHERLPRLPGHRDADGDLEVVTHSWTPPGRRIELGVSVHTEYERTRESLWTRIQNGWAFEDEPDKVKVVRYEVDVELVDTTVEHDIEAGANERHRNLRSERVRQGGELF